MPGVSTFSLETIINIDGSPVFWVALQREESKAHVTKDKTNLGPVWLHVVKILKKHFSTFEVLNID